MKSTRLLYVFVAASLMALSTPARAQAMLAPGHVVSTAAHDAALAAGRVRVVVAFRPEPGVAPGGVASPGRVRGVGDALLKSLPSGRRALLRRFQHVPALVLDATAADLRMLDGNRQVSAVDLDVGGSGSADVAPDEASRVNLVSGLDALGLGGQGQTVAIIDSGVDANHADLRRRLIGEACFCSALGGGSSGCCPSGGTTESGSGAAHDANGHGTNVAGIVVGEGHVAPRGAVPDAKLVAVRVMDDNNRFCCTSDLVAAMDWIATQYPDVAAVNLSLGTRTMFAGDCDGSAAWTQALAAAVDALVANGAVVTVSSGNDGSTQEMQAPACVRKAVAVAATWDGDLGSQTFLDCTDAKTAARKPACFSNRSPTTDLFAAGAFVTSTGLGGRTSTYGGTSQAAPMAAACAVALKQAAPASTVGQRMDAMTLSMTRIVDAASGRKYPFLDCRDAVALLNPSAIRALPGLGSQPLLPPVHSSTKPARPSPGSQAGASHGESSNSEGRHDAPRVQRQSRPSTTRRVLR